jgi:hypothetical protein
MKTIRNILTLAALAAVFAACSLGGDIEAWRAKAAGDSDTDYNMPYPIGSSFPSAPENLRVTENSAYVLAVQWDSVSGADYYRYFVSFSQYFDEYASYAFDSSSTNYHWVSHDLWSFVDTLYIKVCAYQYGYGEGYYSSTLSVSRPSGGSGNITPMFENQWLYGSISSSASNSYNLYSMYVNSWQTYYVWWNDRDNSGETLDIKVMVSANEDGSSLFFDQDTPNEASFTPYSSGTVYIKVYPLGSGSTGSYGIAYSASSNRP